MAQHGLSTRDLGAAAGPHKPLVASDWTVLIGLPPRAKREAHVVPGMDGTYAVTLDGHTRQILTHWTPPVRVQDRRGGCHPADRPRRLSWTLFHSGAATEMRVVSRVVGALAGLMPVKTPPNM